MNPYSDTHNPYELEPDEYLGDLSDFNPLDALLGKYSIPGMVVDRVLGDDNPAVLPGPAGIAVDILDLDGGGGKVVPSSGSTSADPRQISSAAQVREDAANLRKLGYSAPDTGNAYDPALRAAMRAFQAKAGLTADGLTGPATRAAIAAALGRSAPSAPSILPGLPAVVPASDKKTDPSSTVGGVPTVALAIGGVVALGLVGVLVFGGKKKGGKKK